MPRISVSFEANETVDPLMLDQILSWAKQMEQGKFNPPVTFNTPAEPLPTPPQFVQNGFDPFNPAASSAAPAPAPSGFGAGGWPPGPVFDPGAIAAQASVPPAATFTPPSVAIPPQFSAPPAPAAPASEQLFGQLVAGATLPTAFPVQTEQHVARAEAKFAAPAPEAGEDGKPKRVRRTKAQIAADNAAAEAAKKGVVQQLAAAPAPASAPTPEPMTLPFASPVAVPPPSPAPPPAMPPAPVGFDPAHTNFNQEHQRWQVWTGQAWEWAPVPPPSSPPPPAPPAGADDMSLDDFKRHIAELQAKSKTPALYFLAGKKIGALAPEACPGNRRAEVLNDMAAMLAQQAA